jgi:hypothetical protein
LEPFLIYLLSVPASNDFQIQAKRSPELTGNALLPPVDISTFILELEKVLLGSKDQLQEPTASGAADGGCGDPLGQEKSPWLYSVTSLSRGHIKPSAPDPWQGCPLRETTQPQSCSIKASVFKVNTMTPFKSCSMKFCKLLLHTDLIPLPNPNCF